MRSYTAISEVAEKSLQQYSANRHLSDNHGLAGRKI
jgi:hypothetical protein